ncbi:MAG: hypothetical protein IKX00_03990 [Bacilli bacterium]|nr:hypothetical protein [Bacilli bacterium]
MKDKFMLFIIGLLLGAVIATGAFYVYSKSNKCDCSNTTSNTSNNGQPPEMPSGQNGQPPEKPGESNSSTTSQSSNQ